MTSPTDAQRHALLAAVHATNQWAKWGVGVSTWLDDPATTATQVTDMTMKLEEVARKMERESAEK